MDNEPLSPQEAEKSSRSLEDIFYILKRAGLGWLVVPGAILASGATVGGVLVLHYIDNYKKGIAGTVERIIKTEEVCPEEFILKAKDKGIKDYSCIEEHSLSTTKGITKEAVRIVMEYDHYEREWGKYRFVGEYPEGRRSQGELVPAHSTGVETTTYTMQGKFFWLIPRYARHADYKYNSLIESYDLAPADGTALFRQASKYTLTYENIPSDSSIEQVARELVPKIKGDSNISIIGYSSPEGDESNALTSLDSPSYGKNLKLANQRAHHVHDKLIQLAPELAPHIKRVIGVVNLLTPDEVTTLMGIVQRKGISLTGNEGIHNLITLYEKGRITLSQEDKEYIQKIFHRKTTIIHRSDSPLKTFSGDDGFEMDVDMTLWPILILFLVAILGTGGLTYGLYLKGLGDIMKDYDDENVDPKKKRIAKEFLTDAEKKEAIETGKFIKELLKDSNFLKN